MVKLNTSLLAERRIDPHLFDGHTHPTTLEECVAWAYDHIYSHPYPEKPSAQEAAATEKIARPIHGIQHASRVTYYLPVFVHLYQQFGDEEALTLTDEQLFYLQIAALFHDTGRLDEGKDYWDKESAEICYYFLTTHLSVPHTEAAKLAEAIANKDRIEGKFSQKKPYTVLPYKKLRIAEDGTLSWKDIHNTVVTKNIYQKVLHDADCLDILRVRDRFQMGYLDFYRDIAKSNPLAFDLMAKIIIEARRLISFQGDLYTGINYDTKLRYDHSQCYSMLREQIAQQATSELSLPYLSALHRMPLSEDSANIALPMDSLQESLENYEVYFRGITQPNALTVKRGSQQETQVQLELYKDSRQPGIATRSVKHPSDNKYGNLYRSISLLGGGSKPFTEVGFYVKPDIHRVHSAHKKNISSGAGSKKKYEKKSIKSSAQQILQQLSQVKHSLKKGGSGKGHKSINNEIIYHLSDQDIQGVIFTEDAIPGKGKSPYPSQLLKAIYLQMEYTQKTHKLIPLMQLSLQFNTLKVYPNPQPEELIALWKILTDYYIDYAIKTNCVSLFNRSVNEIKVLAGLPIAPKTANTPDKFISLDINYDDAIKEQINQHIREKIQQKKSKLLTEVEAHLLEQNPPFDLAMYFYFLQDPNEKYIRHHIYLQKKADTLLQANWNRLDELLNTENVPDDNQFYFNLLNGTACPRSLPSSYTFKKDSQLTELICLYDIAIKADDQILQEKIRQCAEKIILSAIRAFDLNDKSTLPDQQLKRILYICEMFGLTESLLPQIQNTWVSTVKNSVSSYYLSNVCDHILAWQKYMCPTEQCSEICQAMASSYCMIKTQLLKVFIERVSDTQRDALFPSLLLHGRNWFFDDKNNLCLEEIFSIEDIRRNFHKREPLKSLIYQILEKKAHIYSLEEEDFLKVNNNLCSLRQYLIDGDRQDQFQPTLLEVLNTYITEKNKKMTLTALKSCQALDIPIPERYLHQASTLIRTDKPDSQTNIQLSEFIESYKSRRTPTL